jgi:hypothetical protein
MSNLMRERALDLKYEMLCERTKRRQEAAKADLVRRGVAPRTPIASGYVLPVIAAQYVYLPVGGVR